MMRIRKRISGLALALLTAVCSAAFAMDGHDASGVPASGGGTPVPSFMSARPLFARAGTVASAFVNARAREAASRTDVTIFGHDNIPANEICYWDTSVNYGTPPYTYQWYGGSSTSRNQPDFFASATHSFWLEVKVTDAYNVVRWGSLYVTVSSYGACIV